MFLALLVATQSKLGLQSVLLLPHSSRLYLVVGVATDLKSFPLAAAESWCRGRAHWGGVAGSPSGGQLEQPVQHCRESPLLYVSGAKGPPAPHSQHLLSLIPCVLQQNFWLSLALGWCVLIFIFKKKRMLSFQTRSCQDKMIYSIFFSSPIIGSLLNALCRTLKHKR